MNEQLQAIVEAARASRFNEKSRGEVTDAKMLGILVAEHFEWNGEAIVATFVAALRDSNYHDLCRVVTEAWRDEKRRIVLDFCSEAAAALPEEL